MIYMKKQNRSILKSSSSDSHHLNRLKRRYVHMETNTTTTTDLSLMEKVSALIEEQALTKEEMMGYLRQVMEIRALENNIANLLSKAVLKGASHLYAGQEAVAVGAIAALRDDDLITSTHRGHGHAHAHGDKAATTPEAKQEHYNKMMAEVLGKSGGYCKGKGGSMHIADVDHGNLGATGIVGGNIPVAVGAALAQKLQGTDRVVICFFGDGASNTGNFHESLNMASLWDLPVVFVVENNLYAMSVPWVKASKLPDVATRAAAYGIPGEVVDGMDALVVRGSVAKAAERARRGEGPTLIECKTYRWYGHSHSDPRAYRTREEEAEWKRRDPITVLKQDLQSVRMLTDEEFEELDALVDQKLDKAMEFSEASPEPNPAEVDTDVFAPLKTTAADIEAERKLRDRVRADADMRQISYAQALVEAQREEMQRDESVFIMGEDVGLYGGAYGATRGLSEEFGDLRVLDTPISEATIGGAAVGAAMAGMRPIAEIMYVDFTPLAMDQIANQGAKNRYMFGGKTSVPMVIRTEGGAGRAIAAHHSQSLESLWTHFPGIYVVMPSTPYDAKGLLKAAIRDDNPVMFIEHKMLYKEKGPVPEEEYIIPLGVADIKRPGKDITLVTYSRMVLRALAAAEELAKEGIDVEVIDLRSLKPLDMETILASVKKTGRLVGVTEAYENTSFINEVMIQVNEIAFDYLDAPMVRVAARNMPVPRAEILEDQAIPNEGRIMEACRKVVS
jgi:2-oxoisovalerate dehydrogenase E1 component